MSQEEEDFQPGNVSLGTSPPGAFVPPSIIHDSLLLGESYEHYSPVPLSCRTASTLSSTSDTQKLGPPCSLGIDEAGRGPVLGPMVYGAFYLPIAIERQLLATTHHFDDSKVLTPAFRSSLMQKLCEPSPNTPPPSSQPDPDSLYENCGWAVSLLSARSISAGMLQPSSTYNLNAQAMDATISLINGVYALGINVKEIYIDTIGQPAAYQKKLERIFPNATIVVAKKADSLYPCVSAASVCAKVTRDVALEVIYDQNYGHDRANGCTDALLPSIEPDWGSGYPSDIRCTAWLKRNMDPMFGWGNECRFSWGTAKDLMDAKDSAAMVTWPVQHDEETSRLTEFFGAECDGRDKDELACWFGQTVKAEVF